jgi:hypothetical protein
MVQLWKCAGRINAAEPRGASQIRVPRISESKYLPPAVSFPSSNTSCSIALAEGGCLGAAFSGRAAKGGFSHCAIYTDGGPSLSLLICCSAMVVSLRFAKAQRASRRRASWQVPGDGSPERRRAVFFLAQQRDQACGGRGRAGLIVPFSLWQGGNISARSCKSNPVSHFHA